MRHGRRSRWASQVVAVLSKAPHLGRGLIECICFRRNTVQVWKKAGRMNFERTLVEWTSFAINKTPQVKAKSPFESIENFCYEFAGFWIRFRSNSISIQFDFNQIRFQSRSISIELVCARSRPRCSSIAMFHDFRNVREKYVFRNRRTKWRRRVVELSWLDEMSYLIERTNSGGRGGHES